MLLPTAINGLKLNAEREREREMTGIKTALYTRLLLVVTVAIISGYHVSCITT
jgi:hypothetical protein